MINLLIHTYFLFLIDTHVSRKHLLVIFVILRKQCRCVQSVRTFALAFIAVQAVFDLVHLLLPFLGEPRRCRGAAQHERHARTLVDLDARGARHAVAAAAAEFAA